MSAPDSPRREEFSDAAGRFSSTISGWVIASLADIQNVGGKIGNIAL
jgi:hypothetical protein